jgi:predicted small integral membrane protein
MVIGGEWFQMWQSSQWNGQQPGLSLLSDNPGRADLCHAKDE